MANFLDKRDKTLAPIPTGGATDKIEKYQWAKPGNRGKYREIAKSNLNLDDRYQREKTTEEAVRRIARNWDWVLYKVLSVAERGDGSLWVFDGGHRLRAAFYRSDVNELPCLVFQLADLSDEARSFIAGARMSSRISSFDSFRAALVAEEPCSLRTAAMLAELGLKPNKNASKSTEVKCVYAIQKALEENEPTAKKALELSISICGEKPVPSHVFLGFFRLARHFNGEDLLSKYEDVIRNLTQEEVERSIRQFRAETGKGGQVVSGKAIMTLLNKGKKTRKLKWDHD